jgi:hypothetical protein
MMILHSHCDGDVQYFIQKWSLKSACDTVNRHHASRYCVVNQECVTLSCVACVIMSYVKSAIVSAVFMPWMCHCQLWLISVMYFVFF